MWLANSLFPSVRRLQARLAEAESNGRPPITATPEELQAAFDRLGPVPPEALRLRVGRWDEQDIRGHLASGGAVMVDIECLLKSEGRPFTGFSRVLEFGCGCGRIARWAPPVRAFTACDIDAEAIRWCQANLSRTARFVLNDHMPPLPFGDAAFDLIYCISVFTHLPEDMEHAWLGELCRVLEPGGLLLATVVGDHVYGSNVPAAAAADLSARGFAFIKDTPLTPGLPEFFRHTLHQRGYVEREWAKYFDIVRYEERGVVHRQDAVLCLKRT